MRYYGIKIEQMQKNVFFDIIMERLQYNLTEFLEKNKLTLKQQISIML